MARLWRIARKWTRRLLKVTAALVLFLVVAAAAVLAFLHTDYGRGVVKRQLESQLSAQLQGKVHIGRLRGSVLSGPTLESVTIYDAEGTAVAGFETLELDYSLRPLVRRRLLIRRIGLRGMWAKAKVREDGTINLQGLLPESETNKPKPNTEPGKPSPWVVHVGTIVVEGGALEHTSAAGQVQHIDEFGLRIDDVKLEGGAVTVHSFDLSGLQRERGVLVRASGNGAMRQRQATGEVIVTTTLQDAGTPVEHAERPEDVLQRAAEASSEVRISDVSVDTRTMTGTAHVTLRILAATARLVPAVAKQRWIGDVKLSGTVSRASPEAAVTLELRGTVADANVTVEVHANPEAHRASLTVEVADLDLQRASMLAPPGGGSLRLVARAGGTSLASLGGTAELTGRGRFRDVKVSKVRVSANATKGVAKVTAKAVSNHGGLDAGAVVLLGEEPMAFRDLRVNGNLRQLARLMPPRSRVRGSVSVSLRGSGDMNSVDVSGVVNIRGARMNDMRVPYARATLSAKGPIKSPRVRLEVRARRVRVGMDRIDGVRVSVRTDDKGKKVAATVRVGNKRTPYQLSASLGVDLQQPNRTAITVRRLVGRMRGLPVTVRPGARVVLRKGGDVQLRGLSIRSAAGNLDANGLLSSGLDIKSKRIAVATLARRLGLPRPHPQGVITVSARVRRRGLRLSGKVSGTLEGFALARARPKLGGSFRAEVGGRKASLFLKAGGARVGTVSIDVKTVAPWNVADVRAWKRIQTSLVESAEVQMIGLDLEGYQAFVGRPRLARGRLSGTIKVGRGATTAEAELRADGVGVEGAPERVTGRVTLGVAGGRLRLDSTVEGRTVGGITAHAEAHVPFRLMDAPAWKKLDEYAVDSARIQLRSLDLSRLRRIAPTLPRLRGRVAATVQVAEHVNSVTVTATTRKLRAARSGAAAVDATLRATVGPARTVASVEAKVDGVPVMSGSGSVGGGLRTLIDKGPETMKRAAVRGRWKISNLSLRTVADELKLEQRRRVSGLLTATSEVTGTVERPSVSGTLDLGGARFDKVSFTGFEVRGSFDGKAISGTAVARQKTGGKFTAAVKLTRGTKQKAVVDVDVSNFDLGFLASLDRTGQGPLAGLKGVLDAHIALSGPPDSVWPAGWVKLSRGAMRMEGVPPLHDVVAKVEIDRTKLTSTVSARSGVGALAVTAQGRFTGRKLTSASALVRTKRFPVVAGQQKITLDSSTRIAARHARELWNVNVVVDRGLVRVPTLNKQRSLHTTKRLTDVVFLGQKSKRKKKKTKKGARSKPGLASGVAKPTMRLKVRVPDSVRVRSDIAQATLGARLDITMVGGEVVVDGDAKTSRGRVDLLGRRYKIRTAEVAFDGSVPPNPTLRVELAHSFDALTLYVDVTGTASAPKVSFRSDPGGYDKSTLLGIFLGRDPDDASTEDVPLEDRAMEVASGLLIEQVQSVIRDVLPIDVLKVEVDDMASQRPSRVTVGKWVSDDLFVAYRYSPTADDVNNTNEAQLEYRLNKRWSLEGTYGDQGKGGVDILWIRRY